MLHNIVTILNATELYTSKQLKWKKENDNFGLTKVGWIEDSVAQHCNHT